MQQDKNTSVDKTNQMIQIKKMMDKLAVTSPVTGVIEKITKGTNEEFCYTNKTNLFP
ncbi:MULTISPECIES: hypothetical protein [Bacillus cereus group]|uniref:hypothetical protein n=1 Tax=Bacillus cereus group TaxID=86661 RepID=UPI0015EC91E5|nr:hypothetical protein [Bacillus cereus]